MRTNDNPVNIAHFEQFEFRTKACFFQQDVSSLPKLSTFVVDFFERQGRLFTVRL